MYFNPLPRKEGDIYVILAGLENCYFNPLPRKEGDNFNYFDYIILNVFQSTPS